jgi:hypothetical protein
VTGKTAAVDGSPPLLRYAQAMALLRRANPPSSAARPPAPFFKGGYFDGTVRSDKVAPFFKGGYFDSTVRSDKVVPFEKGGGCGASAPHGGFASCWNVSERLFARTTHAVSATC